MSDELTGRDLLLDQDEVMDQCRRHGWDLYRAEGILSHERIAYDLGYFLYDRIGEQPATAETAALLSIVRNSTRIATYFSNGRGPIRQALATLVRLALPYQDHPDYREEWRPR